MARSTSEVLTTAIKGAHWLINVTFADVDDELANRPAPGTANPLGTAYAHLVLSEDAVLHGIVQGAPPLSATSWVGRTGVDVEMPMVGMAAWYKEARVDVGAMKEYAAAVFAATEEYVAGLSDDDLDRMIELPFGELGSKPLSEVITMLIIEHCDNYAGEISAIKGVFGLKGYPF